jgi:hypothetical protein
MISHKTSHTKKGQKTKKEKKPKTPQQSKKYVPVQADKRPKALSNEDTISERKRKTTCKVVAHTEVVNQRVTVPPNRHW